MSFPAQWAELPGPTDFLAEIVRDLASGYVVVVGVPTALPYGSMSVEVTEGVHRRGLGSCLVFREREIRDCQPRELYRSRVAGRRPGQVALVDARFDDEIAGQWRRFLFERLDCSSASGLCVVFHDAWAEELREQKGLRIRLWREFVSTVDARVVVQRGERGLQRSVEYVELKCALVAELADGDLEAAYRLSECTLKELIDITRFPCERVWSAQVAVLLPLVDRERRRLLDAYRESWVVPYSIEGSRRVEELSELEVSHMVHQARENPIIAKELGLLRWLRAVRNSIAHMRVVNWATLVSPHVTERINFRDK